MFLPTLIQVLGETPPAQTLRLFELVVPLSVVLALASIAWIARDMKRSPSGTPRMQEVADAIKQGSRAYLKRQYKTIIAILLVIGVLIYAAIDIGVYGTLAPYVAASFILGTLMSLVAGYVSMEIATISNLKTAASALQHPYKPLRVAFKGGLALGLSVVALSLAGVAGLYYLYWWITGLHPTQVPLVIMGYGFGASLAALFAQLGGGIYTKAADIGADLVGKVEAGIPEDDPRNPATIADNVGDNVGDCAGRGADLFESISAENIGSMIIGAAAYVLIYQLDLEPLKPYALGFILYPLIARAIGLIATLVGQAAVTPKPGQHPNTSLAKGLVATTLISAVLFYPATIYTLGPSSEYLYVASILGMVAALAIEWLTEYYTEDRYKPTREIAEAANTGPATTVLAGLSVGMRSSFPPIIVVLVALAASYMLGSLYAQQVGIPAHVGGIYGTVVATIGMLALTGIILAMDGYGPIADNANGILEMTGNKEKVGETAELLDAAGNTTKALAKGFAVGSALLAALLLFQAYVDVTRIEVFNLAQPSVIIGLTVGIALPFLFSGQAIKAVSQTASVVINEVRRQLRENPAILNGGAKPDYARVVDIVTLAAQKNMVVPSLATLATPIAVGVVLGPAAAGATLLGTTLAAAALAFFLNTGGGAMDNAKKYYEARGMKRSDQHKATVIGDVIGDPMKDTAGPSLHIVIKLVNNVAIVFAGFFLLYALSIIP